MGAHLAIFSLIFLKCGCKKLLVQLHSPCEEQEGAAAGGWQGRVAASLPPAFFRGRWGWGEPAGKFRSFASGLLMLLWKVFGDFSAQDTSLQWSDRGLWTGYGVWTSALQLAWGAGTQNGLGTCSRGVCSTHSTAFQCTSSAARNPSSAKNVLCEPGQFPEQLRDSFAHLANGNIKSNDLIRMLRRLLC